MAAAVVHGRRVFAYLWASPATAPGLLLAGAAALTGGRLRVVSGVVEAEGGVVSWLLRRKVCAAMTLGHVILARDRGCLERSRPHERIHVRQFKRWGLFLIPAYLLCGLILRWRGGDPYLDNPFEREASDETGNQVG
jgi:hypothetical protein